MSTECVTWLDYLENRAEIMEPEPLFRAHRPKVYTTEDSQYLQDVADRFPIDRAVDFAAETHNIDPARLSSLAIHLQSPSVHKQGDVLLGAFEHEPVYRQGALHYPVINVAVGSNMPSRFSDFGLRHELRHVFQRNVAALYNRAGVGRTIRYAGIAASAACVAAMVKNQGLYILPEPEYLGIPSNVLGAAIGGVSVACAVGGWKVAWMCSGQEWDANIFAMRTRSFHPFTDMRVAG